MSIDLKTGVATQVEIPNAGGAGASQSTKGDNDDILLTIAHPAWDMNMSLATWILTGPGPRDRVRPIAARRKSTGEELPLTVIPLQYRNDDESRKLIASGDLLDPWKKRE